MRCFLYFSALAVCSGCASSSVQYPEDGWAMTAIRPSEQERLELAALALAPDLDLQSLSYFGNADDTARASYITVRSTDDEHADRWKELRCLRTSELVWSCSAYPKKALRLKLEGGPMLQVEIPTNAGGRLATRWVRQGLPMVQTSTLGQNCFPEYGDGAVQHEELKQAFARVQGSGLTAIEEPGGFALIADFHRVFFDFDPASDLAPRLRCWSFPQALSH